LKNILQFAHPSTFLSVGNLILSQSGRVGRQQSFYLIRLSIAAWGRKFGLHGIVWSLRHEADASVCGQIDLAHPARAELLDDAIVRDPLCAHFVFKPSGQKLYFGLSLSHAR
jgi:hypothetical protein